LNSNKKMRKATKKLGVEKWINSHKLLKLIPEKY